MIGASILPDGPMVCPCGKPATCLQFDPFGYRCDACKRDSGKASEFEATMDRLLDAQDEESAMEAAKAVLLHLAQNRDRIARALRRDDAIENPSVELAEAMGMNISLAWGSTHNLENAGRLILHGFREVVK